MNTVWKSLKPFSKSSTLTKDKHQKGSSIADLQYVRCIKVECKWNFSSPSMF